MNKKRITIALLSMVLSLNITAFNTTSVFADSLNEQQDYELTMPMAAIQTLTYTLSPNETKTTYKYSVPSGSIFGCDYKINTSGGSISGNLYGAYSTATANHSVDSGNGDYGTVDSSFGSHLKLSSSSSYPLFCASVTNTSSKTISVTLYLYAD